MQMLKQYLRQAEVKQQRYVFETLKLDAGTHTWQERMRQLEEKFIFGDRVIIITSTHRNPSINDYIR